MDDVTKKVTLDDPALRVRTRLQTEARPIAYTPRPTPSVAKPVSDITPAPVTLTPAPTPEPPLPEPVLPVIQPKPQTAGFVQLAEAAQDQTPAGEKKLRGISRHKLSLALTVLAVIAFGAGIFVGINSLKTNRYVSAQIANLRKVNDPNAPSEDEPSSGDLDSYKVPPGDPRILSISKLDVKTRVRKLGVKADNELAAPNNIFDAGWYEGSSRPDEAGAMLIDGHVQGPTKPGIFMNLGKLAAGDQITVERGDGQTFQYHVVKTQTFDSNNMDMRVTLNSVDPDKKGLNIITCAGQYDPKTKNYAERLVVFAVQD